MTMFQQLYHQAVSNAADLALANAARKTQISSQLAGVATSDTIQPNATILHDFARKYWNGNDEALRRAVSRMTEEENHQLKHTVAELLLDKRAL